MQIKNLYIGILLLTKHVSAAFKNVQALGVDTCMIVINI